MINCNNICRRQRALWRPAANNACERIPCFLELSSQTVSNDSFIIRTWLCFCCLFFWKEHVFVLRGIQGKTKALFNLIMTHFSWFYNLNVGHLNPCFRIPLRRGRRWRCIKTYLVLNLALWLFFFFYSKLYIHLSIRVCVYVSMFMNVCAHKCWVRRRIPNCSVSEQLHLTT